MTDPISDIMGLRRQVVRPADVQAALDAVTPPTSSWFHIDNAADGGSKTMIRVTGTIGGWWSGTSHDHITRMIDEIDSDEIEVAINSPGGNVFEGIAIYNALRAHKAKVTTRVEGIAASIASVIVQAGDDRQMMTGSQLMIHNPWGGMVGDASELRKFADVLDQQTIVIAEIYAERAGGDPADFVELMAAETWLKATDAVDRGLADRTVKGVTAAPAHSDDTSDEADDADDLMVGDAFDPSLSLALLNL